MHIGPGIRVPVGREWVFVSGGISKEQTLYEERTVGLLFSPVFTGNGKSIHYQARGLFKASLGISEQMSEIVLKEVIFSEKRKFRRVQ